MFLIAFEGTDFGWTIFFTFLGFGILFNELDEREKEIEILRSAKDKKSQSEEG